MEKRIIALLCMAAATIVPAAADDFDAGLWLGADATVKLNKKWNLNFGAQYRTRNNFRTTERFGLSAGAGYKFNKHLKASAGYIFFVNNFEEKLEYKTSSTQWMPSYYGVRHRFFAAIQGDVDAGRFNIALRQRWQYTYRPQGDDKIYKYDTDDGTYTMKDRKGAAEHILRTRLKIEYNIPKCPVDPYVYGELFYNGHGMEKYRAFAGAEWKINKQHSFDFGCVYQREAASDGYNFVAPMINYNIKF